MARQITGAKLYLAGGHTMQIGAGPVAELVQLLEQRPDEVPEESPDEPPGEAT